MFADASSTAHARSSYSWTEAVAHAIWRAKCPDDQQWLLEHQVRAGSGRRSAGATVVWKDGSRRSGRAALTFEEPTANPPTRGSVVAPDHPSAARILIAWLEKQVGFGATGAVGHRVVHGIHRTEPAPVTAELLVELRRITPFDPDANNAPLNSPDAARVRVRVMRADEELMIARSVERSRAALTADLAG